MDGIINVIKPPGISSHQVVRYVRKLLNTRKVGHTGTLDPGAAGVLPICVGQATRIAQYLVEQDKVYIAEMTLGIATKSQDASGETTEINMDFRISPDFLGRTLSSFLGQIEQIPPMSSAIRHDGQRLYELERQGITVERKPRKVIIKEMHINKIWPEKPFLAFGTQVLFSVRCSKGTYIRTLCHDVGRALNTYAHMSYLVRTANGPFTIEDGITLEEFEQSVNSSDYSFLKKIEEALPDFLRIQVSTLAEKRVLHGNPILYQDLINPPQQLAVGERVMLFSTKNNLLAIAEIKSKDGIICQPICVLGGKLTETQ